LAVQPALELGFEDVDKKHNSTGLQLAYRMAHPIGRHVINPDQPNRAYDILEPKLQRGLDGQVKGHGLKKIPIELKKFP
jgi:hypothetical protein